MKRVFSSHSEVAHVWAQQVQDEGRAGNIFFRGNRIYSYGHHYTAAVIHTRNGKPYALINSHRYSSSTCKHLSEIRRALTGNMFYFEAPDVDDIRSAVKLADAVVEAEIARQLKRVKVTDPGEAAYAIDHIQELAEKANKVRGFAGLKPKQLKASQLEAVLSHLDARYIRWQELEARPERVEARRIEAERRAERERVDAQDSAEALANFRAGLPFNSWRIRSDFDLIRIEGDEVRTSQDARVPLAKALEMLAAIETGQAKLGDRIGHYSFDGDISDEIPPPGDTVLKFGCHRILLSEARAVLTPRARLKLVSNG